MKTTSKILILIALSFISAYSIAQSGVYFNSPPTAILQITLDATKLTGSCNLATVDTVYMHSGADRKNVTNQDSIWQSIVGDWGLDDGKGEMLSLGNHVFSICFNVIDFYTTEADSAGASTGDEGNGDGPLPPGSIVYNIGMVFRQPTCPFTTSGGKIVYNCTEPETGKDENCKNFYLLGVNQPLISDSSVSATDYNGYPLQPGTLVAKYITACAGATSAVDEISGISKVETYPVPFNDFVWIHFNLASAQENTVHAVEIFNELGQKVCDLNGVLRTGVNSFSWKGTDNSGRSVAPGIYIFRIINNGLAYTGRVVKQ